MISMPWFRNELNEKYLVLCTGIGFILFGITGLIISCWRTKEASAARRARLEAKAGKSDGQPAGETAGESVPAQGVDTVSLPQDAGHQPDDSIH